MELNLTIQPLINCRAMRLSSTENIVVLEDIKPKLMEMINIYAANGRKIRGKIIQITGTRSWAQVFEDIYGLSLDNVRVECTGEVFKMPLSEDMIGGFFDGSGNPRDKTFISYPEKHVDIEGRLINPVCVRYPDGMIQTGIGVIDLLNCVAIGREYTIYSAAGLPHNDLVAQIIRQAAVVKPKYAQNFSEELAIVFAGIGLSPEAMRFFTVEFQQPDPKHKVTSFMNRNSDPMLERLLTPRLALAFAEYLAFEKQKHVLVVLTDMADYCDAMRSLTPYRGSQRQGYPVNLGSDLASLLDRPGVVEGSRGSLTIIPVVTVPNDDVARMDMFSAVTDNFLVLDRKLNNRGIYPPIDILRAYKICRVVGFELTREDHRQVAIQLYQLYSAALEVAEARSVVGESTISAYDQLCLEFQYKFEERLLRQSRDEARSDILKLLDLAWELLRMFPREFLRYLSPNYLCTYYPK
jgi:V-type H+-transporting ATPase subunit B